MFNLLLARQEAYSYAVKKIGIIDTFRTTDVRVGADLFAFRRRHMHFLFPYRLLNREE